LAALLFGRRPAAFVPTPGIVPRIDRRSELAKGLVGLWFPGGGSLILDLTGNMPPLTASGTGNGVGPSGYQARDASASYWSTTNLPAAQQPTAKFSLLYLGQTLDGNSGSGRNQTLLGVLYDNGEEEPYVSWAWAWVSGKSQPCLFWSYGTGYEYQDFPVSGTAAAGDVYSIVGTVALGGSYALWSAGALSASGTADSGAIQYSSPTFYIGGSGGEGAGLGFSLGGVWNRALTAGEAQSLSLDPWQLLEWPWDRVPRTVESINVTTTLTGDESVPAEYLTSVAQPSAVSDYLDTGDGSWLDTGDGSYLDTGRNILVGWAAVEALTAARADPSAVAETGGSVARNSSPPVEATDAISAPGIDAMALLEAGLAADSYPSSAGETGTAVGSGRSATAEAGTGIARDSLQPTETSASLRTDLQAPREAELSVRADPAAPTESSLMARADPLSVTEIGATSRIDATAETESVGPLGLAVLSVGWLEWLAALRPDALMAPESGSSQRLDVVLPAESPAGQQSDRMASLEALASAICHGAVIEALAGGQSDAVVPAEAAANLRLDAMVPTEVPHGVAVRTDEGAPVELLLLVRMPTPAQVAGGQIEIKTFVAADPAAPAESAANFAADKRTAADWAALSESDRRVVLEWLRGQAIHPVGITYLQLETLMTAPPPVPYIPRGRLRGGVRGDRAFAPLTSGASDNFAFDFTAEAGAAAIVSATWVCVLRPYQTAPDTLPQSHVLAQSVALRITTDLPGLVVPSPVIGPMPAVVMLQGGFAVALVGGFTPAQAGALYNLAATVTTSDGRTLSLDADLPIAVSQ
jgi:hypothetical protein